VTTLADIQAAAARIRGFVHRTPVLTSATLDRELDAHVFAKCENLQKCGAFKARGACNAVLALDDAAARRGVITHSSGNHGAALAYASGVRGIPCTVVMPDTAPDVKVAAVKGYGAEVHFCKAAERDAVCARLQKERGTTMVHPFENPFVIAGQGTAALELVEDVAELDAVIAPVGGGGLCAGTAVIVRQPRVEGAKSWADGLMTGLGEPNFALLQQHDVRIVTVSEEAMLEAARFFLQRMKIVVEPSSATVLAALREIAPEVRGKRIGMILSGGNTDFGWLGSSKG